MSQLYFLRHGESEANLRPDLIGGRTNEAKLSPLGETQARRAGKYLLTMMIHPSIVHVSPAVRTLRTAELALGELDYHGRVVIDPRIQELSQGLSEGLPRVDVYTPEVLAQITEQGASFKLPGGESVEELGERMYEASRTIDQAAERIGGFETKYMHLPVSALIVTHETAIKALVARTKHFSQHWVYETHLPNASLTRMNMLDGRLQIDYLGKATNHG